jgi:hypothetical protein
MARLYLTAHPYGVNAIGYQGIDERADDQIEVRGDRMLTHKNSTQRKWHRCAELVILAFVVTVFSSCSKSESADMNFLALLGGGGGGAADPDPSCTLGHGSRIDVGTSMSFFTVEIDESV